MKIKYKGILFASIYSTVSLGVAESIIRNQVEEDIDVSLIELEPETSIERVGLIRRGIAVSGDTDSLLGTASDNANLLLVEFSKLVVALDSVETINDIKLAAASFKDSAYSLLAKIEADEYRFPYQQKGNESVLIEVGERATAVNDVLFNRNLADT